MKKILLIVSLLTVFSFGNIKVLAEDKLNVKMECDKTELKVGESTLCGLYLDGATGVEGKDYALSITTELTKFATRSITDEEFHKDDASNNLGTGSQFGDDLTKPLLEFMLYAPDEAISTTEKIKIVGNDYFNEKEIPIKIVGNIETDSTSIAKLEIECPEEVMINVDAVCDLNLISNNTLVSKGNYSLSTDAADINLSSTDGYADTSVAFGPINGTYVVNFSGYDMTKGKIGEITIKSNVEKETKIKLNNIELKYSDILSYSQDEQEVTVKFVNNVTSSEKVKSTGSEIKIEDSTKAVEEGKGINVPNTYKSNNGLLIVLSLTSIFIVTLCAVIFVLKKEKQQ